MILSFKLKTKGLRLHGCGLCTKNKTVYLTFKRFTNISPFIKALSLKINLLTHHLYFFIPSDSPLSSPSQKVTMSPSLVDTRHELTNWLFCKCAAARACIKYDCLYVTKRTYMRTGHLRIQKERFLVDDRRGSKYHHWRSTHYTINARA